MERSTPQLDPLTVLRDTRLRFQRRFEVASEIASYHLDPDERKFNERLSDVYEAEVSRLDDLIGLCDGTATVNASSDTLPVAAETAGIDGLPSYVTVTVADSTVGDVADEDAPTLPLMPRSGLTPSR